MSELDVQLTALRARRRTPGLSAWLRGLRPFDRRSIREPADRDVYWATVQLRLAESDAVSLTRHRETRVPRLADADRSRLALIG
jgi:transposase